MNTSPIVFMADKQAYHVSKGLECIKAIRGSTIKKEQLQELYCIYEEASSDESRSSIGARPGEKSSLHLMEPTTPTIGSGDDSPLYSVLSHIGPGTNGLPATNAAEERTDGPTPQIQCNEVHDNSSQETDGHEGPDGTVVPTGSLNTGQLSQGKRGPDESTSDTGDTDSPRSSTPNGGPVARLSPEKFCDVTTVTGEELAVLLNKGGQKPSSSKVTKILKIPPAPEFLPESIDSESIKKGTEGKSISFGKGIASGSTDGAILCVQKSPRSASEPSAHVETVPPSVTTAATILDQSQDDGILTNDDETSSKRSDKYYDDDLYTDMQELKAAVKKINEDNQAILSKLDAILTIKGEIDSIKRQISKQNLAISTIEGHLSSIMIAIPGFGKADQEPTSSVDINPDLRPIISRDSGRAVAEVLKQPASSRPEKADQPTTSSSKRQLLKELQLKPIDKKTSSAIGFTAADTPPAKSVLASLIKSSFPDHGLRKELLSILRDIKGSKDIKEFHQMLKGMMKV